MIEICHEMQEGEILNASHLDYPFYRAKIYGDKLHCAKLSKRLSCTIKHLPVRVAFSFEYDSQKALDRGIQKDPTMLLDGEIFIEGLIQAEEIRRKFERLLIK